MPKRQNITTNAIAAIEKIRDGVTSLQELKLEYATAGTFADSDFTNTDLQHVSAAMVNALFGGGGTVDTLSTDWNAVESALLAFIP